jgi:hypothetical protein
LRIDFKHDHLSLAYVEDAHNLGCVVRLVGAQGTHRAHYSAAIQGSGVIIRAGHMAVVDRSRSPFEVVWRIGTRGTVEGVDAGIITLDLGYRTLTMPLRDERPEGERARAVVPGDRVLLRGAPIEEAAISDLLVAGELAHPERLAAYLADVFNRHDPITCRYFVTE